MNYTTHYNLPQWELSDRIMMEDFNQAMASIDQGMAAAQQAAEEIPFVIGSYTGNGAAQTIDLGFRPRFLHITGTISNYYNYRSTYQHEVSTGGDQATDVVQLTDTGFTVMVTQGSTGENLYPMINQNGHPYTYIAFR